MSGSQSQRPPRRKVEVLVLSDLHLGTVGCHAAELLRYLKSVDPQVLVLNGDIIDCWQFKRWYWPKAHMKVVKRILKIAASGVPVHYVTGNHDDMLRRFSEQHLGNFHLVNKVVLELDGKRAWIFHGDVFDVVTTHSRWLARLGGMGYDLLILINRAVNGISQAFGRGRISLSKRIKEGVKSAVSFIGDFEKTTASMAVEGGFDFVLCGHIHQPVIKDIDTPAGRVLYLNSGDWIENLTALEYAEGRWSIFRYQEHEGEIEPGNRRQESDPEETEEEESVGALLAFPSIQRFFKGMSLPGLSSPKSQP